MTETRKLEPETCWDDASLLRELAESSKLYYQSCRDNAEMTQEEAAHMLNIDVSTLSRYENGRAIPDQQVVARMVLLYKVPRLAVWHVKRTYPDLVRFLALPEIIEFRTDGDTFLALDISSDALIEYKADLKRIYRIGGAADQDAELEVIETGLKKVADDVLSIASYISGRRGA